MNDDLPIVRKSIYSVYVKRLLDICLSGLAIVILSPLMLILVILELIFHGRPVIYASERPGLDCKLFRIYKFRTMTNEVDENGSLLPGCERVTAFGRILRKLSLDELPELFCIFTGKMSIIGPRPLLPEYLDYYSERHKMRHSVRPGFACVPLNRKETWTWRDQFENDIFYIENVSFKLDICMIFAVVKEVFRGSEYRVADTRGKFTGDNLDKDAS